ncbi:hypothetical protein TNCV_4973101 [Trichonephila clavipes]|nr:hypothetical protein TNCV_4973101 [Trichonephila clavipes]
MTTKRQSRPWGYIRRADVMAAAETKDIKMAINGPVFFLIQEQAKSVVAIQDDRKRSFLIFSPAAALRLFGILISCGSEKPKNGCEKTYLRAVRKHRINQRSGENICRIMSCFLMRYREGSSILQAKTKVPLGTKSVSGCYTSRKLMDVVTE